ncbi:MAG: hypothetical protein WD572_04665 [Gammaproteobacteria bacterium]
MKLTKLIALEIILILSGLALGLLWSQDPKGNYEPYIVVVTLILGAIEVWRRKNKETHEYKPECSIGATDISPITVGEIIHAINTAPPFQKEEMSEKYNGIKVDWIGYLKEAKQDYRGINNVRVNLNIKRNDIVGNSIWFTENITKFPDIRSLNRESKIRVIGKIISASGDGLCVEVKPSKIEILARENA